MNLHQSSGKSDWSEIPRTQQNHWQKLANQTSGVVTPGNFFTVVGLALVFYGLFLVDRQHYWAGLVAVLVGRACDIFDGQAAERTGTKSPLGEALDAGFDKVASLAAFGVLLAAHIIPWPVAVILLLPNLSNAGITVYANRRLIKLHPSRYGKLFMASSWVSLAGYVLLRPLKLTATSWLGVIATLFLALAFYLGLQASLSYVVYLKQATPK